LLDVTSDTNWAFGAALVYQSRSDTRYAIRGSTPYNGSESGCFLVSLSSLQISGYWPIGAALSYKFIKIEVVIMDILFVVLHHIMVFIVDLSLFILLMILQVLDGILVLL